MITDVPSGFEAHKLISISLGKIAASRSGRTGASLHKSLLVASVLHKARFVYFEEAHHYQNALFCTQGQSEEYGHEQLPRASTPLPEVTVTPITSIANIDQTDDCESRLSSEEISDSEDDSNILTRRKRRRVTSEQEIEAAVSSILPKRLKSNSGETVIELSTSDSCSGVRTLEQQTFYESEMCSSCGCKTAACQCSDTSSEEEECNMEVDHITSLVSIFSFNQQQQSDLCSTQVHQAESVGPPVLALTA